MESKYDRVAYPENVYLHSDGEMDDFGTGVYPIQRRPYRDDSTFKVACIKVKRRFRFVAVVGILIFVLSIVAIAVIIAASVSKQNQSQNEEMASPKCTTNDKKYGLYFHPCVDDKSLINFNPTQFSSLKKYVENLDHFVHDYNTISMSEKNVYVECNNSTTGPPDGKECKLDAATTFGHECIHLKEYGYDQGRPCVLLVLNLPPDVTPKPFGKNSSSVTQLLGDRWSPDHVGITCDGEDEESRGHMRKKISYHDDKNRPEGPMDYLPPQGFPVSFFVKTARTEHYKPPAVMVHFNNILNNALVKIQCVAWAQNFNNGQPQSSLLSTAKFQFYIL